MTYTAFVTLDLAVDIDDATAALEATDPDAFKSRLAELVQHHPAIAGEDAADLADAITATTLDHHYVKDTTPYQGWTNRATWNLALWFGNDESLYHRTRRPATLPPWDNRTARCLGYDVYKSGVTPDGADLRDVDWTAIAEAWNEE